MPSVGAYLIGAVISWGVSFIITKAVAHFRGRPKQTFGAAAEDQLTTVRSTIAPHRVIYGRARVGGTIVFLHNELEPDGDQKLHMVIAIAGHQIAAVEQVWFNDDSVPVNPATNMVETGPYDGAVRIEYALGTADQAAFAHLIEKSGGLWTADHRGRGRALAYVKLKQDPNKFPDGVPNITFLVKGRDEVYDPRTDTSGFSTNPALCLADYLTNSGFGLGEPWAKIDETQLIAAANLCDEDVLLADGVSTETRYTCNGTFTLDDTPEDIIQKMLTAMGGSAVYASGLWRIFAAGYRAPTVELTEADLRAPIQVQTRVSRRELLNAVRGVYVDPGAIWMPTDYPIVTNAAYEAQDGERIPSEMDLPFTISPSMAQRLAKIHLEQARQQITVDFPAALSAYRIQAPDVVNLTIDRYGWAQKPFEVMESILVLEDGADGAPVLGATLRLSETAPEVYDWNNGEETERDPAPDTTLPDPFTVDLGSEAILGGKAGGSISGRVENLDDSGAATESLLMTRAAGNVPLTRGQQKGTARDGEVITFTQPFEEVPAIKLNPRCQVYNETWSAAAHWLDVRALAVSPTGFTMYAKLAQLVGSITPRSEAAVANLVVKSFAPEAVDDWYTFNYTVDLPFRSSLRVGFWTREAAGAWVLRSTKLHANLGITGSDKNYSDKESVNVDGLGLNAEFKVTEEAVTGGATATLNTVSWDEGTPPPNVSATPDANMFVEWIAQEGS
jgi:hypothetical protein